ncbi:tetraspanin-8-like [Brachyistius frenatus]|uniref:tetraspanin-8-like n=1 Tax=Brachyistius frenatus TaxID=100188 RepID=UPI0037E8E970
MAKINGCLKCLFIFFNVVFAIFGCLMIFGTVKATAYSNQLSAVGSPGLGWSWVFSIGVLGISCLGIYAGCADKELPLKIFACFMAVGMFIMMIFGIVSTVARNKMRDNLRSTSSELVKPIVDNQEMMALMDELQQTARCCGVVSSDDWGDRIPYTCACQSSSSYRTYAQGGHSCKTKPQGALGPDQIYSQSCADIIIMYVDIFFHVVMGVCFGFAVTALLGLLISLLMIHQIKRYDGAGGSSIAMKAY